MKLRESMAGCIKSEEEIARSRCGATAPGVKTKRDTTGENKPGRIGKDEVTSSNLVSSSTKTA